MDKAGEAIGRLAEQMGIAAQDLWPYLVARARLEAVIGVVIGVVLLVIAGVAFRIVRKGYLEDDDIDDYIPHLCAAGLCSSIGLVLTFGCIGQLVYPQADALKMFGALMGS